MPCMYAGARLTCKLHESLCVRAARNPGPALGPQLYVSFWQKQHRNSGYMGINSLRNIKNPNFRIVRVDCIYLKISHLHHHFFLFPKQFFFLKNLWGSPSKTLVAHSKIFIKVCASGALSGPCLEIREWQVMLSVHAEITWCLSAGVNRQWMDQWTDEKIFMVRFSCVVPSFWQSTVVMNPAPQHGPFWKRWEKRGFFMHPLKKRR